MNKLRKLGFLVLALVCTLFVFASCKPEQEGPTAAEAAARISTTQDKQTIVSNFVVNNQVVLEGVTFTVTWESDNAVATVGTEKVDKDGKVAENGAFYLVTINYENNNTDQTVKLTATVANGEDKATKTITFTVPKFKTASFEEYAAAAKGDNLTVEGIVTGMNSKSRGDQDNSLYFNSLDNKGGFYAYQLASDPVTDGIKEGMTVKVSGKKDLYSGTYEIVDPTVTVIDQTIKTVTPVDLTDAYKAAEDLKAAELVGPQALLVTIKGVTITTAEESNGYYKFTLAGKESYIRVSSSNCPLDVEDTKTFKDEFAKHAGWIANATGIVSVYNGAFYLQPISVDAFEYISLPELSEAEEVAAEKSALTISKTSFISDASFKVALEGSVYKDVKISWASNNEAVVIDDKGNVTVKLGAAAAEVKLTATLKSGAATDTKEFTLSLAKKPTVVYSVITNPVAGTAYKLGFKHTNLNNIELFITGAMDGYYYGTVEGAAASADVYLEATTNGFHMYTMVENVKTYFNVVKKVDGDKTYINVKYEADASSVWTYDATNNTMVTDVDGTTYFLGTNATGTYKTLSATKLEKASTSCISHFYVGTEKGAALSNVEVGVAYKFAFIQENIDNKKFYLTGAMDSYYFASSEKESEGADVYLETTTDGFYMYAMVNNVKKYINIVRALGDDNKEHDNVKFTDTAVTVWKWDATLKTVVTTIGEDTFNLGTRNDKTYKTFSACKAKYESFVARFYAPTGEEGEEDEEQQQPSQPETPTTKTVAEVLAAADDTKVTFVGVVTSIKSAWNSDYNNMDVYVSDTTGSSILVFRASTQVAVGDKVTVTGSVDTYAGAKQIAQGSTVTKVNEALTNEEKAIYDTIVVELPYSVETELTLPITSSFGSTLTWTSNNAAIAISGNTVVVTQGQEDVTVTLTATFVNGTVQKTKTYNVIVKAILAEGVETTTLKSDGSTDYVANDSTDDYAQKAGLDANLFSVKFSKNSCTNGSGIARFHNSNGLQLYGGTNNEGASFTVEGKDVVITKITVYLLTAATIKVNGTSYSGQTTYDIDLESVASFTLQAAQTSQVKISKIEIVYQAVTE